MDNNTYVSSRQGASHIRAEKPCQDDVKVYQNTSDGRPILIMAVADGHGSEKYDMSQYGAQIATETAIQVMLMYEESQASKKERPFFNKSLMLSTLKCDFPNSVVKRWREKVAEHWVEFSKGKEDGNGLDSAVGEEKEIYKRYGTTLLVALVVPAGAFFCQIGDGDVVVVDDDGNIEEPLPAPPDLVGNETHSLTSSDSMRLWRITPYSADRPFLIVMGTDGLSNCFEHEQFLVFCQSLKKNINEFGLEKVGQMLPEWLDNASKNGSGDDISIAIALINPKDFGIVE